MPFALMIFAYVNCFDDLIQSAIAILATQWLCGFKDFLEDVLLVCAEDLESVGIQHYGGENIDTSQATDISSQRRRRTKDRSSLFVVQDSSGG
jgi:hypothetical protein